MSNESKVASFIEMCPLIFLTHQVNHYTERAKHSRSIAEQVFLEKTIAALKKYSIKFYN